MCLPLRGLLNFIEPLTLLGLTSFPNEESLVIARVGACGPLFIEALRPKADEAVPERK